MTISPHMRVHAAGSRTLASTVLAVAVALGATGLGAAALPATARADHDIHTPFTGTRPFQLDFHGGFTWYGRRTPVGFAGGARFGIPIVHNGFVPSIDNAVYINFGVDTYFINWRVSCDPMGRCWDDYGFALGFPITLHWEFYFSDMWSVYAELGVQIFIPPEVFNDNGRWDFGPWIGHWIMGAVGGTMTLSDAFSLTLRVGNPYIAFGVQFLF